MLLYVGYTSLRHIYSCLVYFYFTNISIFLPFGHRQSFYPGLHALSVSKAGG